MSSKQNKGRDPVKRAAKRQRQRAAGYKRPVGGAGAQATHASSNAAVKKAREGEEAMERERDDQPSQPA